MTPIKIKRFHRVPIMLTIIMSLGIPICLCFLIYGIIDASVGLIAIGIIPLALTIICLGLFLNYGIHITQKRVILMNQRTIKMFRYDDVVYIDITFTNTCIEGKLKAKNQKPFEFCFDGVDLNTGALFRSHLSVSGLKLTDEFVEKSIAALSTCNKVHIKKLYEKKKTEK